MRLNRIISPIVNIFNRNSHYDQLITLPLMKLYGKNDMTSVDWLLTSFYKLDDESRLEVTKIVEAKLEFHTDSKRAKDVENIKGW